MAHTPTIKMYHTRQTVATVSNISVGLFFYMADIEVVEELSVHGKGKYFLRGVGSKVEWRYKSR